MASEKTYESLVQALAGLPDRTRMYLEDELTLKLAQLGVFKSGSSGADADTSTMLKLRTGGKVDDSTVGRGKISVESTFVIYTGAFQFKTWGDYIANKKMAQNGMEGRYTPFFVPPGTKAPGI